MPPSISKEEASTVPLAAATAWLALFSKGCLNLDRSKATGTSVLVWGGSCMQRIPSQIPTYLLKKANDEKQVLVFIRSSWHLSVALMWLQHAVHAIKILSDPVELGMYSTTTIQM